MLSGLRFFCVSACVDIGYGLEVDMWAAGVILYILLCGFPPFRSPDRDQDELFNIIQLGHFEFLAPYWDNISDGEIGSSPGGKEGCGAGCLLGSDHKAGFQVRCVIDAVPGMEQGWNHTCLNLYFP
jgi:serine/threonine protein kinase